MMRVSRHLRNKTARIAKGGNLTISASVIAVLLFIGSFAKTNAQSFVFDKK